MIKCSLPYFLNQANAASIAMAMVCLTAASGVAAQQSSNDATPAENVDIEASVESARSAARAAAIWLASGVDSWFGDKPFGEGGEVSDGELNVKFYSRQDQKDYSVTFSTPSCPTWSTTTFTGRDTIDVVKIGRRFAAKRRLLQHNSTLDTTFLPGLAGG
jgi:hypothetical protein